MDKRELIKSLYDAGHRESALKLQNWNEEDNLAKSFKNSLEVENLIKSKLSNEDVGSKIQNKEDSNPKAAGIFQAHLKAYNAAHPHLSGATHANRSVGQDEFANSHHNESLGHYVRTGKILTHSKKEWDDAK